MEVDLFCVPSLITLDTNGYHITHKSVVAFNMIPNTEDNELTNYYIHTQVWRKINDFLTGKNDDFVVRFMLGKIENGFKEGHELNDVTELYESLNMNLLEDHIKLHNYCCRRLREILNRKFPDRGLIYKSKSSRK